MLGSNIILKIVLFGNCGKLEDFCLRSEGFIFARYSIGTPILMLNIKSVIRQSPAMKHGLQAAFMNPRTWLIQCCFPKELRLFQKIESEIEDLIGTVVVQLHMSIKNLSHIVDSNWKLC